MFGICGGRGSGDLHFGEKMKGTFNFLTVFVASVLLAFSGVFAAAGDDDDIRIVKVDDGNFEREILNSDRPVILEFSSTSCPPCLIMIPTLIGIAKNYRDIKVASVGIDEPNIEKIKNTFDIRAFPTFYFIRDGKIVDMKMGALKENELLAALRYTPSENGKKDVRKPSGGGKKASRKNLVCAVDGEFGGLKNHVTISFVFGKNEIKNVDIVTDVFVPPELENRKDELLSRFRASGKGDVTPTATGFRLHTGNDSRFMKAMDMKRTSTYGEMKAGLELQGFSCR